MFKYSIIIPTFNHLEDCLKPCLESIKSTTDLSNAEVIVVANGCTDGTEDYVKSLGIPFKVLSYPTPLGYTVAVNNGLVAATGEFVILLNNDVIILGNNWIDLLRNPFEGDIDVGITGPVKFVWNCKGTNRPAIAFWCCMFKRELLDEIGVLDEDFNPGMGEDGEFCVRCNLLGHGLVQVPHDSATGFGEGVVNEFPIFHKGNGTFGDDINSKDHIIKRNDDLLHTKLNTSLESQYYLLNNASYPTSQLLPILRKYANRCDHVIEMGVEYARSTVAFLVAKPRKILSYEIEVKDEGRIRQLKEWAQQQGTDFEFILRNTLDGPVEETDFLFIDTRHTYEQLSQETFIHGNRVRKYIAFHDTNDETSFGTKDEFPTSLNKMGLNLAIKEFLSANPHWKQIERVDYSYGLTVLERTPKFSIIIPTCNYKTDKLKTCIDRILQFTNLIDKEIIVVTNGCDADVMKYLYSLRRTIRVVNLGFEKVGQVTPVNIGLEHSRGEYVIFIDDDSHLLDQVKDDWVQRLYNPFVDNVKVGMTSVFVGDYPEFGKLLHNGCTMYKRSVLISLGGFDEAFGYGYLFDADISLKYKTAGYELVDVGIDNTFPVFHPSSGLDSDIKTKDIELIRHNKDLIYGRYSKLRAKYSIIIPTYNHLEDCLKPCLESLKQHTNLENVEVLVVANGCKDGTREYVESLGSPFRLIWIDEGLGYTKATNIGIKESKGDYVVLLNNDTQFLDKGQPKNTWMEMLEAPFKNDPTVGLTGPLQLHDDYADRDVLIFFCVMISRKVIDTIGLLDEVYAPGGGEDVCYVAQAQDAGFKQVQVPSKDLTFTFTNEGQFPIYHLGEGTFNDKEFPEYSKRIIKNNGMLNMIRFNKHIKLNLGSGGVEFPGYISVDKFDKRAHIISDVFDLKIPDNTVEEILASHLFEHVNPYRSVELLSTWNKMLKPSGKLIMEMPDIEKTCAAFATATKGERYGLLNVIYGAVNTTDIGDPSTITASHMWGWYPDMLWDHLVNAGFVDIKFMDEQIPHPGSNFRVEARKP